MQLECRVHEDEISITIWKTRKFTRNHLYYFSSAFQRVREQKEKAELEKILKGSKEKKEESDEEEELPVDGEDPIECLFGGRGKMKRARANTEKGKDAKKAK